MSDKYREIAQADGHVMRFISLSKSVQGKKLSEVTALLQEAGTGLDDPVVHVSEGDNEITLTQKAKKR